MAKIITQDTTWSSTDVVKLSEDVQVAPGVVLTIEPGATVYGQGHEIVAFGTVQAGQVGKRKSVSFDAVHLGFGGDHDNPGRIELRNVDMDYGSLFRSGGYGSFSVAKSDFYKVDGFYVWYPTSESEFKKNTFHESKGISVGADHPVTIENNNFIGSEYASNGGATIVCWASYGGDDDIRVINNSFYDSHLPAMELPEGYSGAAIYADGNFIAAAQGGSGEDFVLDSQDSLNRASDIDLRDETHSPHPDTPSWAYRGGAEYDSINGSSYHDRIFGLGGGDLLNGESGRDTINGGAGNDTINGGAANDNLQGGKGRDVLRGDAGSDTLAGGAGNDIGYGQGGRDILNGNAGNDYLNGGRANDSLQGGKGRDILAGGAGDDTLSGDAGNDALYGNKGDDYLTGGKGGDTFVFMRGGGSDTISDFELKRDVIRIDLEDTSSEDLTIESDENNTVVTFRNVEITLENIHAGDLNLGDHFLFS